MAAEKKRKRAKALLLYEPGVTSYRSLARQLNVTESTIRRWVDPASAEKALAASRRSKAARRGVCEDCGGETRYGGHRLKGGVSRICAACQLKRLNSPEAIAERTVWPIESIIEAIQRWGAEHGEPPRIRDFHIQSGYPSFSTVIKRFGTWNQAIEAAGFEPRLPTDRLLAAGERKKGEDL